MKFVVIYIISTLTWIASLFMFKYYDLLAWNSRVIIFSGLGSGLLTVRSLKRTARLLQKKLLDNSNDFPDEDIIQKDGMNHFRGAIADGGVGYLLKDKLVFVPHKLNLSKTELAFQLSDIKHISGYKILGIFDTGIKIELQSGKVEKFVIDKTGDFYKQLINLFDNH